MLDIEKILILFICCSFGAMVRAAVGLYKAYTGPTPVVIEKRRIGIEIVASMLFGSFSIFLLQRIPVPWIKDVDFNFLALIAGFLGADGINLLTKKIGLTKGLEIRIAQPVITEFNKRQLAALEFLKTHEKITNRIYQELNMTTRNIATYELQQLVLKGKLKKHGKGKETYYTLA
jgi:hypothetical protein